MLVAYPISILPLFLEDLDFLIYPPILLYIKGYLLTWFCVMRYKQKTTGDFRESFAFFSAFPFSFLLAGNFDVMSEGAAAVFYPWGHKHENKGLHARIWEWKDDYLGPWWHHWATYQLWIVYWTLVVETCICYYSRVFC